MLKKILFVDDDLEFVQDIMDSCLMEGSSYSYADSIKRAGDLLLIDKFDLIIANSKVPGGSSLGLKDKITSDTEIVFMSSMENDYNDLKTGGENCYRKYELKNSIEAIFNHA